MGRKKLTFSKKDRDLVEDFSASGVPLAQIAALTCGGVSIPTLTKHFKDEIIRGKAKANFKVGKSLFERATKGDTTAAIFWAKTQMQWRDRSVVEAEKNKVTIVIKGDDSKV